MRCYGLHTARRSVALAYPMRHVARYPSRQNITHSTASHARTTVMHVATMYYSELRAMLNALLHFRNCMLRDPGESAGALRSRAHRGGAAQARTGSARPHLHRDMGFTPPTSAPGLWAQPARICTGTGLTPPTTAPGLWAQPCHICNRTLGSASPHLH